MTQLRLSTLIRCGARLAVPVALLSVFGGCWAGAGSATLDLTCAPEGALVVVSGQAVGRCGQGVVGVAVGLQTVEVTAPGRLPLRLEMHFSPLGEYLLDGNLEKAVRGLDPGAGSGAE